MEISQVFCDGQEVKRRVVEKLTKLSIRDGSTFSSLKMAACKLSCLQTVAFRVLYKPCKGKNMENMFTPKTKEEHVLLWYNTRCLHSL